MDGWRYVQYDRRFGSVKISESTENSWSWIFVCIFYAIVALFFCVLYMDYASTKKYLKKFCYITAMILCLFHALMMLFFTVYFILPWGKIVTLLLYFHTEAYFQRTCYCIEFYHEKEYVIISLWQEIKHNIHPLNRYNNILKYCCGIRTSTRLHVRHQSSTE